MFATGSPIMYTRTTPKFAYVPIYKYYDGAAVQPYDCEVADFIAIADPQLTQGRHHRFSTI